VEQIRDLVIRAATAVAQNDRIEAYGQLVQKFRDMACGYAYSILGDFHLAEDAAQDAFVTAYRRLGQLRQPDAFPGWFRSIVWTTCGQMVRRKAMPTIDIDTARDKPAKTADPSAMAEATEMRNEVLRAISQLPDEQREVTTLFYINGYSQKDIADFLEVPVGTVKNRLTASRGRLKERMLKMVKDTLHTNAPDERFDRAVIDELLLGPKPLEIPGHPVRQVWEAILSEMSEYEAIDPGSEVEDERTARQAEDHAWDEFAYRFEGKALRCQMTTVTMSALAGRRPPVRILAAGRVFRPIRLASHRAKVFHQFDGVCVEHGADVPAFKATCERLLNAAVPGCVTRWTDHDTSFVKPGFQALVSKGGHELEILGGGMLLGTTLENKGFDPRNVSGYSWGLSLDRLAMLRFGIDDIRELWKPPYVS
jgi:RNA polymerase sigma factor (sigma-70 family)